MKAGREEGRKEGRVKQRLDLMARGKYNALGSGYNKSYCFVSSSIHISDTKYTYLINQMYELVPIPF